MGLHKKFRCEVKLYRKVALFIYLFLFFSVEHIASKVDCWVGQESETSFSASGLTAESSVALAEWRLQDVPLAAVPEPEKYQGNGWGPCF